MIRLTFIILLFVLTPRFKDKERVLELPEGWKQINEHYVIDDSGDTLGVNYYEDNFITFQTLKENETLHSIRSSSE